MVAAYGEAVNFVSPNEHGGFDSGKRAEGMLAIVKDMREVKEKLDPKPSLEAVTVAEKAISEVEHRLIDQLSEITSTRRPYGVEPGWFVALQAMKEDRCRRDADLIKLPHVAVVELNNFHRHYEAIIAQAEAAILNGGDGPVGLQQQPQVGGAPRIVHYPASGTAETLRNVPSLSSELPPPQTTAERQFDPSALPPKHIGGLSAAFQSTHSSGELAPIPETEAPSEAPLKLLAMIEDAAMDKREKFSVGDGFGELTWLPESIGTLSSLTHLDLSGNRLRYLPSAIGSLPNLKILDLYGNQLTELPETIGNLGKLLALDFHSNRVEELPASIGACGELMELVGDINKLRGLPESLGNCQSLQKISFSLNQLTYLPRSIGSLPLLTDLDVHYNQLEWLPDSLCLLPGLERLNVAAQHTALTALPSEIGQLATLQELNASQCQIKFLPDSFQKLGNLQKLQLGGNPLQDPPLEVAEQGKEAIFEYISNRIASKGGGRSRGMEASDLDIQTGMRGFFRKASDSVAGTPIVGRRKGTHTPKGDGMGTTPKSFTPLSSTPSGSGGFWSSLMSSKGGGGSGFNSASHSPTRG